jgi:hypothetical protein
MGKRTTPPCALKTDISEVLAHGIPVTEQARRGIEVWLQSKGAEITTERKRAAKGLRQP